jgi:glutathione peroxidase-family protein
MKDQQIIDARNYQRENAEPMVVQSGVIELDLTDNKQQQRRLTDLRGKVVLLDFHTFKMQNSPQRILMLRGLYNKYHEQGFEIYQISLDQDEHFWRQMTLQLPWISVRDESGSSAMNYNVSEIPEYFLIDRNNTLYKRSSQMEDLEDEIKTLIGKK